MNNKIILRLFLLALVSLPLTYLAAQTDWQLKKDEAGIKIYASETPGSEIKAIKVECVIDATMNELSALLLNAKAHEDWVYGTRSSYIVKKINDNELIYYSEMSMPWPVKDRDVVVHFKLDRPDMKTMSVSAVAVAGHVAAKSAMIRVPSSTVHWTVKELNAKQLHVAYVAQADPGGSVPAWAVNAFCTKGPFETFRKLRGLLAPVQEKKNIAHR